MSIDPNDRSTPSDPSNDLPAASPPIASGEEAGSQAGTLSSSESDKTPADEGQAAAADPQESSDAIPRRKILIGSQRDPAAYRPKPKHDWIPVDKAKADRARERREQHGKAAGPTPANEAPASPQAAQPVSAPPVAAAPPALTPQPPVVVDRSFAPPPSATHAVSAASVPPKPAEQPARPVEPAQSGRPVVQSAPLRQPQAVAPAPMTTEPPRPAGKEPPRPAGKEPPRPAVQVPKEPDEAEDLAMAEVSDEAVESIPSVATRRIAPPSRRDRLTPEMEEELTAAMDGMALDDLMHATDTISAQGLLEPDSRHQGRVLTVQRDDVFVELGSREQGVLPVRQFETPPEPGTMLDVVVSRFNAEEGLYDLTLPFASAKVADWGDLSEGMVVEARVTGSNTGGLECEVNHIRGFIPVSQIALYRVDDLAQFVDQKFSCVVTEANPERRNLVLSRRAVLEREREEARHTMLESLAPGQLREGVIRKIMDFGAFVDLGSGVDGLLHISQMSWTRIKHPSEMFQEGQAIKVRVEKFDVETGRIGLSYRETLENPWTNVESKYPPRTPVHGKVTRLMEFGAFVELEPGVEGLVHISELSRKHVRRVNEVVKEGDEVDVLVLSVDPQAKRISLSMKEMLPPDPDAVRSAAAEPEAPPPPSKPKKPAGPLQGGLGRAPGGKKFGLKW